MPVRAALVLSAMLISTDARAFEGTYENDEQTLTITRGADGHRLSFDVGTKGCAGRVEAAATLVDGTLVTAKGKAPDERSVEECRLKISRTAKGVRVDEERCLHFHGAACSFAGDYPKK